MTMIPIRTAGLLFLIFLSATNAAAQSPEAESYYLDNIDSTVRSKCIGCHIAGGRAGYTSLLFTDSASSNHKAFDEYVNTPSLGAKASTLLEKIRGAAGHGGGVQVAQGSSEYGKFERYMELLTADNSQQDSTFRIKLEEPIDGEVHMGVGNLRGWSVASSGITKIEIYIDGVFLDDAPYGSSRGDIGAVFPDVENSTKSGFSQSFNYGLLDSGSHTIKVIAYSELGNTIERSATFDVVKFSSNFISDPDAVNLNDAACSLSEDNMKLFKSSVEGELYDVTLTWRKPEQGFEIVEIEESE